VRRRPRGAAAPRRLLAFAAPPLLRSGPPDEALVAEVAEALGVQRDEIVAAAWLDNGPGWVGVQLASAAAVLAAPVAVPASHGDLGLVGLHPPGAPEAVEVRAFFGVAGRAVEDPVTGSLNASVAQWLLKRGVLGSPYVARQGTALGRAGRIHISPDGDVVWVGGATRTVVTGTVAL
jgi:predicted PhzF superfamily epimerase YddE/YHI9